MRKGRFAATAVMLIFVCPLLSADLKLGKSVDIQTPTAIRDILANPEKYVGKEVMIEGEIKAVCQMAGCWIDIKDSSSPEAMQVKVNDGEIVFPKDGAGKKVSAQGTVEKLVLDREAYIAKLKHDEQESGKKADLSKVTGGVTIYRIKGKGAVVR
jgi:hypothetical protein